MKKVSILLLVVLFGCAPKIRTKVFSTVSSKGPQSILLFEKDTIDMSKEQLLGEIKISDSGISANCTFDQVKLLAKKEAKKMGGNCVILTRHKLPNNWSFCHRIRANVYSIKDPGKYESEIVWHKDRRLVIADFKGPVEKRPFIAATFSSFHYNYKRLPWFSDRYSLRVDAYFNCKSSYFKRTKQDSSVLAHEQIHFDITELYARKLIIRIQNEAKTFSDLVAIQQRVLDEVGREWQLKQDEYDSEVYADRSKQAAWNEWIKEELYKTKAYANKTYISPKVKKK